MIVLLNSSKTMVSNPIGENYCAPELLESAIKLDRLLKKLKPPELRKLMHLSPTLAIKTFDLIQGWTTDPESQTAALDAFQGDIYRGLLARTFLEADRRYANDHVRILSGLYGIVRPLDKIMPYRLELMYPLSGRGYSNLYEFWGSRVAATLPKSGLIVDVASNEYSRLIRPFVDAGRIVEPLFLTSSPGSAEPTFVAVHAKVARGSFARWLITSKTTDPASFGAFADLDYCFDEGNSTPNDPVFIKRL